MNRRSIVQELVLEGLADGAARTPAEIRRHAHMLNKPGKQSLNALIRRGHITKDDSGDPTTYRITQDGLSALEAQNSKGTQ